MHFETLAVHAGQSPDEATGAVAPPIHLSTTFLRNDEGGPARGFSYIRDGNPTGVRLEAALAAIDAGQAALAFASGMAAASAILQSVAAGGHVLIPDDSYYAMRTIAGDFFPRWGLTFSLVDMSSSDAVRAAMRPETSLIWSESPSNPLMKIVDLAVLAEIAKAAGARLVVDGTFATPALQRPIELGAHCVLHSTTKYLGGHGDVQGGSIAFRIRDEFFDRVEHARTILGGVASPFNSWLVLRGIRSLAPRMRMHSASAGHLAAWLVSHARVEVVHYPGLATHPGHEIARRQMSDFGGMLSFRVRGGAAEALAVVAGTRIFTPATSLGGVESLIEHRATSEGPGSTTPQNLLRVSVGLEHPDDLIADLESALAR